MNMEGYCCSEYNVINGFKVLDKFIYSLFKERNKPYKCYTHSKFTLMNSFQD